MGQKRVFMTLFPWANMLSSDGCNSSLLLTRFPFTRFYYSFDATYLAITTAGTSLRLMVSQPPCLHFCQPPSGVKSNRMTMFGWSSSKPRASKCAGEDHLEWVIYSVMVLLLS